MKMVDTFIKKNNLRSNDPMFNILSVADVNPIIDNYEVSSSEIESIDVCIKDIYGYDYSDRKLKNNLVDSLIDFFDEDSYEYLSRSVGMLKYTSDNILEGLERTFICEPMYLSELKPNMYFIGNNGLHRFHLLKIHYLLEIKKAKTDEEKEKIDKKYTIPVKSIKIDLIKTYCNFMLNNYSKTKCKYWITNDRYNNKICTLDYSSQCLTLTEEELIEFVDKTIDKTLIDPKKIQEWCKRYQTFNDFISKYFNELLETKNKVF